MLPSAVLWIETSVPFGAFCDAAHGSSECCRGQRKCADRCSDLVHADSFCCRGAKRLVVLAFAVTSGEYGAALGPDVRLTPLIGFAFSRECGGDRTCCRLAVVKCGSRRRLAPVSCHDQRRDETNGEHRHRPRRPPGERLRCE